MQVKNKNARHKRKIRIRKKINGLETKPRLAVYKSNKNIYIQAIDDLNQKTIATSSSLSGDLKSENLSLETAKKVGETMGEKLKELGISEAVFDRGGYIYHGRIKALANSWSGLDRTNSLNALSAVL